MSGHFKGHQTDPKRKDWFLTFNSKVTGALITVEIPKSNVFDESHNPGVLKQPQIERLADALEGIFDAVLAIPDP